MICLILGMLIPVTGYAEEKKDETLKKAFSLYSIQVYEKYDLEHSTITTEMDMQGRHFVKFTGQFLDFNKSARKLEEVLKENDGKLEYIALSSTGGYTDSIEPFGNVIKRWKLPVLIRYGDFCNSTCAYIALYSPKITIKGQLAFHTPFTSELRIDQKLFHMVKSSAGQSVFMAKVLHDNDWNLDLYFRTVYFTDPYSYIVFFNEKDLYEYKTKNKKEWAELSYYAEDIADAKEEVEVRTHKQVMEFAKNQIFDALKGEALSKK